MKCINLTLLPAIIIALSSCSPSLLSCDPDVNLWAKNNLTELYQAQRPEIVAIPLSRQMAIYNGLTSVKKAELWKAKLSLLIDNEDYSITEKKFFSRLIEQLSPELLSNREDSLIKELDRQAKEVFMTDRQRYFFAVCTWMTEKEYYKAHYADAPVLTRFDDPVNEDLPNCDCRHDIGCFTLGGDCNDKADCNSKPKGCGFLGYYECNGMCE